MKFLVLRAYWKLIYFDLYVARGNFAELYQRVRNCPVGASTRVIHDTARICAGIDRACIWYWKQVLCLQRSAATACLLKQHGVAAHMMIGAQHVPFKAHAWVEVEGQVVNDRPYMREMYDVIDQC
jgi:RNase P/RNase MRP subunit p29